jgi:Pyruvate/2-oxoacid:ferredoxin oxidoreductase delta subunit
MSKSKSQTNNEILSSASQDNNNTSQIRVRHVESQHSVDCLCSLCKSLRFSPNSPIAENSEKDKLDWYKGE